MEPVKEVLKFSQLGKFAILPKRQTEGAAGYDLSSSQRIVVSSGSRVMVSTDLAVAIPEGHVGRILGRSGLAVHCGVLIGAGVVDSDYRGEIKVLVHNFGGDPLKIRRGDRIAQLVVQKCSQIDSVFVPNEQLGKTCRGSGAYGSTGGHSALIDKSTSSTTTTAENSPASSSCYDRAKSLKRVREWVLWAELKRRKSERLNYYKGMEKDALPDKNDYWCEEEDPGMECYDHEAAKLRIKKWAADVSAMAGETSDEDYEEDSSDESEKEEEKDAPPTNKFQDLIDKFVEEEEVEKQGEFVVDNSLVVIDG